MPLLKEVLDFFPGKNNAARVLPKAFRLDMRIRFNRIELPKTGYEPNNIF